MQIYEYVIKTYKLAVNNDCDNINSRSNKYDN